MLGRVTQRSIALNAMTNLQNAQARTAKLQEQLSSGKSLSKGSDDSVRAAAALRLNDQVAVNTEQSRNVTDAKAWMTTQENALRSTTSGLQKVRDLTVQAGNGSLDAKGRAAIAAQITEIKNSILGDANTQYQGRAVFSGTTDTSAGFTKVDPAVLPGTPTYTTNDNGQAVRRTISPGVSMQVNISGKSVFGGSADGTATSVFAELDDLAAKITSGDVAGTTAMLGTIDTRINLTTTAMATIGARDNQLDAAEDVNSNELQYLTNQLDDVEGIDQAKTYVEFKMQDTAYQAALMSTAKVIQPTLMDFLR